LDKPLILLAYLGFPNQILTRANTLISVEVAAMSKIFKGLGFSTAIAKTQKENPKFLFPPTGTGLWDGVTSPQGIFLHQAIPNIPGGVRPIHDHTLDILKEVSSDVKNIYRLVVDNSKSMTHKVLMSRLDKSKSNCYYLKGYKKSGPNLGYESLFNSINKHVSKGTFYEVGLSAARGKESNINFLPCPIFSEQLLLTRELYPPETKEIDLCYIGASRGDNKKRKERLSCIGEDFLSHENSFYGGTLFKPRSSIRFPKSCRVMSRSKAHLIIRDRDMSQLPLHRYLQALSNNSIPIVLNEPDEVEFIKDKTLQKVLRVKSYKEALDLINNYDALLPLIQEEFKFWTNFDKLNNKLILPSLSSL
jgi:hypothetical protein